ncbi:MAG: sialidase family protein [Armatimonadia bacterium]
MGGSLQAEHGIICRLPGERLGYFGWPTVARMDDGMLVVAISGLRSEHVCPWGKTVLNTSTDDGRTWSPPRVIQDSPIDDRDAGVVNLGGDSLLTTWFRSDTREYAAASWLPEAERASWIEVLSTWTDEMVDALLGSWAMRSEDKGVTWSAPIRVPVTTPHGPIRLRSGDLLYLGKLYSYWEERVEGMVAACLSRDQGLTWEILGTVPVHPDTDPVNYHEPHVLELPSGRLLGVIRIQDHSGKTLETAGMPNFSMMLTESDDGGRTWATARPLGFHGSPPHLLRHSSGVIILTYGYRLAPWGQRVALSHDDGATWDHDWIIRDDGPDSDLGYPSTVQMADGSLFTVCYQKVPGDAKCSLLWSRWELPG